MRLGQLARKLALRPSQIVDYLARQEFFPEEGSNARLSDEVTERVILHFAPDRLKEILGADENNAETIPPTHEEPVIIHTAEEVIPIEVEVAPTVTGTEEKPEVIKAPKVELSGLKVLGKIELPESKKKSVPVSESPAGAPQEEKPEVKENKPRISERKNQSQRKDSYKQRPARNPIAEQREQKAREEEEKRKARAEREKEKRTQYYLQRVKTGQPTKSMKIVSEPVESFTHTDVKPAPKTWWGKFMRWLNT
jgi:hypothetical protein